MGYHTDFNGQFDLNKPLTPAHKAYLEAFNHTRRMGRRSSQTKMLPDPLREAVGLPLGDEGAYFVGDGDRFGQTETPDIRDYNKPPAEQPGLWCQWTPNEDGTAIEWDEGEKFYDYVEWLEYIIDHFLKPWGYKLNGEVDWSGEETGDLGRITVKNNKVTARKAKITY